MPKPWDTKGHYKGSTGIRIIDRPMTEAERKPMNFYWEWRTDNKRANFTSATAHRA
jgi:hypothetical protein